jgi:hypothetical protein
MSYQKRFDPPKLITHPLTLKQQVSRLNDATNSKLENYEKQIKQRVMLKVKDFSKLKETIVDWTSKSQLNFGMSRIQEEPRYLTI